MHLSALQSLWRVFFDHNRSHVEVGECTLLSPLAQELVLKVRLVQYLPEAKLIAFTATSRWVRAMNDVARPCFRRLMALGVARPRYRLTMHRVDCQTPHGTLDGRSLARRSGRSCETLKPVRLKRGELAGIGAVLCREQDLSDRLGYWLFGRLDLVRLSNQRLPLLVVFLAVWRVARHLARGHVGAVRKRHRTKDCDRSAY
jgi:hypothetical protein